jgi:hypothetical protein
VTSEAVADTDNQKPTDHTRSGSINSSTTTDQHNDRRGCARAPNVHAARATTAIAAARSTEAEAPVSATNHTTRINDAMSRGVDDSDLRMGSAAARRKARFSPDTA